MERGYLLDETNEIDLLMKAEVLRNLGRFEESRLLLDKVKNPALLVVKKKFLAEINNKNSKVF
jgi:hypothetical protein